MNHTLGCLVACAVASAAAAAAPAAVADELRDPTRPPAAAQHPSVVHEPAPVLSAIMGTPGGRVAIFNGRLVRAGSSVGAYVIEAVLDDGVRYRHAGTTHELHFTQTRNAVKQPSTAPARSAGALSP